MRPDVMLGLLRVFLRIFPYFFSKFWCEILTSDWSTPDRWITIHFFDEVINLRNPVFLGNLTEPLSNLRNCAFISSHFYHPIVATIGRHS